jgi:hypothetical protein
LGKRIKRLAVGGYEKWFVNIGYGLSVISYRARVIGYLWVLIVGLGSGRLELVGQ